MFCLTGVPGWGREGFPLVWALQADARTGAEKRGQVVAAKRRAGCLIGGKVEAFNEGAVRRIACHAASAPLRAPQVALGIDNRAVRSEGRAGQVDVASRLARGPTIGIKADPHDLMGRCIGEIGRFAVGREADRVCDGDLLEKLT